MQQHMVSSKLMGVHLYFVCGLNHFAFTFCQSFLGPFFPRVLRKYILTFENQESHEDMELVITAGTNPRVASLRDFLKYVPLFDQVIYSIRLIGEKKQTPTEPSTSVD